MELLTTSWIACCVCAPSICALLVLLLCVLHAHRARWRSVDLFLLVLLGQELISCGLVFMIGVLNALRTRTERPCALLNSVLFALRLFQLITLFLFAADRAAAVRWPCAYRFRLRIPHIGITLLILGIGSTLFAWLADYCRLTTVQFRLLLAQQASAVSSHHNRSSGSPVFEFLTYPFNRSSSSSSSFSIDRFVKLFNALVAFVRLEVSHFSSVRTLIFGRPFHSDRYNASTFAPVGSLLPLSNYSTPAQNSSSVSAPYASPLIASTSPIPPSSSLSTTIPLLSTAAPGFILSDSLSTTIDGDHSISDLLLRPLYTSCTLHPLSWAEPLPQLLLVSFTVVCLLTLLLLVYVACSRRRLLASSSSSVGHPLNDSRYSSTSGAHHCSSPSNGRHSPNQLSLPPSSTSYFQSKQQSHHRHPYHPPQQLHPLSSRNYGGSSMLQSYDDYDAKPIYDTLSRPTHGLLPPPVAAFTTQSSSSSSTAVISAGVDKSLDSTSRLSTGSRCNTNGTTATTTTAAATAAFPVPPSASSSLLMTQHKGNNTIYQPSSAHLLLTGTSGVPMHAQLRWGSAVSCITLCYAINHLPTMVSLHCKIKLNQIKL